MGKLFNVLITDRTLADVNRVKYLLTKRTLSADESSEWNGKMKGRFTYNDMNRLCEYINYVRTFARNIVYYTTGSYPSSSDLPDALSTNYVVSSRPTMAEFNNMLKILNYALTLIDENTITWTKFDYNYFNAIEQVLDKMNSYLAAYVNEGDTEPDNNGWSKRGMDIPASLSTGFFSSQLGAYYKLEIHGNLIPIDSNLGTLPANYFGTPQILDVSKCWLTYSQSDIANNIWREYAFFGGSANTPNTFFKQIILPNDRPLIITNGFRNCQVLESVNVEKITEMGSYSFEKCYLLNNLSFNSIVEIPANCFIDCSALTNLTLGSTLTEIKAGAFVNCSHLTEITYNGTMAQWGAITLGTNWYDSDTPLTKINCADGTINL